MINKIKSGLNKRKVKIFLLFLLCSFLAWFISNLSESYTSSANFNLEYSNVPDSLILTNVSKEDIDVKLKASGFQFLAFNFSRKKVKIDLSSLESTRSTYYVPHGVYRKQIEKQLSSAMTLLDIDSDTLYFDFYKIYSKEVPIKSRVDINLAPNYLLDGELIMAPNVITITGPKNELDSIDVVQTEELVIPLLTSDFSNRVNLYKPTELINTTFSETSVSISGKVSRFSEQIIIVPVEVINLPQGVQINTFPNSVSVLCKAKIDQLKELNASDFQLIADYNSIIGNSSNTLTLELRKRPNNINSAVPLETQVEYILKRE